MGKRKNGMQTRKKQAGQSLVEFAIMLPILLLVLCGIIDFGWIYSNKLLVEFGARDGARFAAINASSTDFVNTVTAHVKANTAVVSPNTLVVTPTKTATDVSVKVDYPIKLLTPVISTIMGSSRYTVSSTCIMKSE